MKRGLILVVLLMTFIGVGCQGTVSPSLPSSEPSSVLPSTEDFFLEVIEPQDEIVVDTSPTHVSGSACVGATVSVNGELIDVDEQGNFTVMVELEEGPNAIEVIASESQGNEESRILAVIYAP